MSSSQPGFAAHISVLGKGSRRALGLHCTMAFGAAWVGISKMLEDDLTLVCPDMPSHGKSPDWDEVSDFSETVFDASMAAMDEGPMDVIGHSFGAATALRMAVEHPDRIRSLTLFEPVFFAAAETEAPDTLVEDNENLRLMDAALDAGDQMGAARAFNRMWSTGPTWDSLPERSRNAMARAVHVVPSTKPFLYADNRQMLQPGRLEAVTVPTLIMRGAKSLPIVNAVNKVLAQRMGNAQEVVIDDAGHMAPISHPVPVAKAIKVFLDRT